MLGDKLSQAQADMLYMPLGGSSTDPNEYVELFRSTELATGNPSTVYLSESWHNFDQLIVMGGHSVTLDTTIHSVPLLLRELNIGDPWSRVSLFSGMSGYYWYADPSSDGMSWVKHASNCYIISIYGVYLR